MFSGRRGVHGGEIRLQDALPGLPPQAQELARLWVGSDRSWVAVQFDKDWQPELLGNLIVECVETAAIAYAERYGMDKTDVQQRIWSGMDEERERLPQ